VNAENSAFFFKFIVIKGMCDRQSGLLGGHLAAAPNPV
jgi:hypothetical protein